MLEPGQTPEALLAAAGDALEAARAAGGGQAAVFADHPEHAVDAAVTSAHGDVIAALVSALGERDRYTGDHSESVVDLAAKVAEALALDAARDRADPNRGAAARHRQGRGPRRDPPQGRARSTTASGRSCASIR